jgi:AraC family transcriptional regulator of arabinose operon
VIGGKEYSVKPDSYVLLRPETPCRYTGKNDLYTDDWMYFENDFWNQKFIDELEIPIDTPVHLGNNIEELSQLIHILCYEHYTSDAYHNEIAERYTDILFLKLSRLLKLKRCAFSDALTEKNYRLTQLRNEIFTQPDAITDVSEMARALGMSRSGFQHLYKKMFGVSVMTDVISSRIQKAKRLLSATNLTVRDIALRCGYNNEYSFMRQFREKEGKTPTEYRNSL